MLLSLMDNLKRETSRGLGLPRDLLDAINVVRELKISPTFIIAGIFALSIIVAVCLEKKGSKKGK